MLGPADRAAVTCAAADCRDDTARCLLIPILPFKSQIDCINQFVTVRVLNPTYSLLSLASSRSSQNFFQFMYEGRLV